MSPNLTQAITQLQQLTLAEQWTLLKHLTNQLQQHTLGLDAHITSTQRTERDANVLLEQTRGKWGSQTIDEIDKALDQQRQQDWGHS
ncbi:MAG: hypothetical protein F6K30_13155 [Cyanothece sp. SIO2G6]|nr:hypothetical protein [Cyanothece sp. SIO2G6]